MNDDAGQNTWSQYYQKTQELVDSKKIEHFLSHIPRGGSVLDFGCGTGRFAASFKRDRPDLKIDAVEAEPEGAQIAQKRNCIHRIYQQSFQNFKPQQNYDAVWIMHSLFFLPKNEMIKVLQKLSNCLKPNGFIGMTLLEESSGNIGNLTTLSLAEITGLIQVANLKEEFRKNFGQQFFGAANEHCYEVIYLFLRKVV